MILGLYLPPRVYGQWLRFFRRYFTLVRTVHVFAFIQLYLSLGLALAYWHENFSHFSRGIYWFDSSTAKQAGAACEQIKAKKIN